MAMERKLKVRLPGVSSVQNGGENARKQCRDVRGSRLRGDERC
jgi:hypothetical protein